MQQPACAIQFCHISAIEQFIEFLTTMKNADEVIGVYSGEFGKVSTSYPTLPKYDART